MNRSAELEMMDLPGQPRELLAGNLRDLRILNRYLGSYRSVLGGLARLLREQNLRSFTLLDVGTGSADIPAAIAQWARRQKHHRADQRVWSATSLRWNKQWVTPRAWAKSPSCEATPWRRRFAADLSILFSHRNCCITFLTSRSSRCLRSLGAAGAPRDYRQRFAAPSACLSRYSPAHAWIHPQPDDPRRCAALGASRLHPC